MKDAIGYLESVFWNRVAESSSFRVSRQWRWGNGPWRNAQCKMEEPGGLGGAY